MTRPYTCGAYHHALTEARVMRARKMAALYKSGITLQEIGAAYGITRERVRQLLAGIGISRYEGGQSISAQQRRRAYQTRLEANCLKRHGCTRDQLKSIGRRAREAFWSQRKNAERRGVGWELTLWQWWCIWQESGHWHERGRGHAYVMCRYGDEGPYAPGNVFIELSAVNVSRRRNRKTDLPMGVRKHAHANRFYAQCQIGGKTHYLGSYATAMEAHAAYLSTIPTPPSEAKTESAA